MTAIASILIAAAIYIFFGTDLMSRFFVPSDSVANIDAIVAERSPMKKYVEIDDAEAVYGEDVNLSFEFAGTAERVFVKEGDMVKAGDSLMKLESQDLELQIKKANDSLVQAQAQLDKLNAGATSDDISVTEKKVDAADTSVTEAKKVLVTALRAGYTQADDAVRAKTNQLFTNPESSSPTLSFNISDASLKSNIESDKADLEDALDSWKNSIDRIGTKNATRNLERAKDNFKDIEKYLDRVALAVNTLVAGAVSQNTIDTWKTAISAARANVDAAKADISEAESTLNVAEENYTLAKKELTFKKNGARSEDIAAAKAKVDEMKHQIDILNNNLGKHTLKSPIAGKIMKNFFEEHEVIAMGSPAVLLSSVEPKIQADVPEDKIRSIRINDNVVIKFSALPSLSFSGKVSSIDPKEVIRDGDVYYRINATLNEYNPDVRSGMTADLSVDIKHQEDVIRIPENYVIEKSGKRFVMVSGRNNNSVETEVETGVTENGFVEIVSGIKEGDSVLKPSE